MSRARCAGCSAALELAQIVSAAVCPTCGAVLRVVVDQVGAALAARDLAIADAKAAGQGAADAVETSAQAVEVLSQEPTT